MSVDKDPTQSKLELAELNRYKLDLNINHNGLKMISAYPPVHRDIKRLQVPEKKFKSVLEDERENAKYLNTTQKEFNGTLAKLISLANDGHHDWLLDNEKEVNNWLANPFLQPDIKKDLQEALLAAKITSMIEEITDSLDFLNKNAKSANMKDIAEHQRKVNAGIKGIIALIPRDEAGRVVEPIPQWFKNIQPNIDNWLKSNYVSRQLKHNLQKKSEKNSPEQERVEYVKEFFADLISNGEKRVSADPTGNQLHIQLDNNSHQHLALKTVLDEYKIKYTEETNGPTATFSFSVDDRMIRLVSTPEINFKNYYKSLERVAARQLEVKEALMREQQSMPAVKRRVLSFRDEENKGPLQEVRTFTVDKDVEKKGSKKAEPTRHRRVYGENVPISSSQTALTSIPTLPEKVMTSAEKYLESMTQAQLAALYSQHFKKTHLKFSDSEGAVHANITRAPNGGYKVFLSAEITVPDLKLNPKIQRMIDEGSQDSAVFSAEEIMKMAESYDKTLSPALEEPEKPKVPKA